MNAVNLGNNNGECKKCAHELEQKSISSMVFQNSPCFDCIFNEDMPKMNRFRRVIKTVVVDEKTADILPFKNKEVVNV